MNQSSSYDWTSWAERVLIGRFCTNIYFPRGPSKHYRYYRFYRYYKHYRYYRRPVQPARKIDLPTYFSLPKSVRLAQDWKAPSFQSTLESNSEGVPKWLLTGLWRRSDWPHSFRPSNAGAPRRCHSATRGSPRRSIPSVQGILCTWAGV